jgi:hypothetical protein
VLGVSVGDGVGVGGGFSVETGTSSEFILFGVEIPGS